MANLGESMQELLSKVATSLGIKASESRRLEAVMDKLTAARKQYDDKIEDLVDEIRRLEAIAVRKKREMDAARGETRRILGREIEQVLRERKSLREMEGLIFSRREKVVLLLRKFEVVSTAQASGQLDIEDLADDAVEHMEEVIADEKDADRATQQLEEVKFEEPERPAVDIASELGEIEGTSEESFELPADMLDELSKLEPPEKE